MWAFLDKHFLSKRLSQQFAIVLVVSFILKLVTRGSGVDDTQSNVLGPIAILYGFFISYLISKQRSRYDGLFSETRAESSIMYSMFLFSKQLPKKDSDKVRDLIANYLIAQLDNKFSDYKNTDANFTELAEYCINIKATTDNERDFKSRIISFIPSQQEKRYKTQTLLEEKITRSEWLTVGSLFTATMYSFLQINTPTVTTFALGTLVCAAAAMMILVLYKLNNLKFNSGNKIFEPLEKHFTEMGLLEYYPKPALDFKEAHPREGEKIRVADYPHEYPDISDKKVEVVKFKEEDYE